MEVYIVFTDTKTSLGRMIKTYTQHPYSHVSLSFDQELEEIYSFGRKNVHNAFIGGFVKEDMRNHLFERAQCAVFKCRVEEEGFRVMREHVEEMKRGRELYKYNLTGLFGVMLKKNVERENAFFCSQFVARLLQLGGIQISDKPPSLVMPRDIFNSGNLEFLYSGSMKSYPFLTPVVREVPKANYFTEAL